MNGLTVERVDRQFMQSKNLRCGIVAIVGRPNVGKSTLLNYILGEKVAIVSKVPQTTRTQIRGIYNDKRGQIVFLDTPGLHIPKTKLGKFMNISAEDAIMGADVALHLVDTSEPPGEEEDIIVEKLKDVKAPIVLGLNKIDLGGEYLPKYIKLWEEKRQKPITEMTDSLISIPISSLKGSNVDRLLEVLFSFLKEGPELYPPDVLTDFPRKLAIADIIREKLFNFMREEVPHSIAVLVNEITERSDRLVFIRAEILAERPTQRMIIIGKKGEMLKKVGTLSRKELEGYFGKKVFLELWVRVEEDWRRNPQLLKELGYTI